MSFCHMFRGPLEHCLAGPLRIPISCLAVLALAGDGAPLRGASNATLRAADKAPRRIDFPNSGFEQGATGWTIPKQSTLATVSAEQAATGRYSLRITDTSKRGGSNVSGPRVLLPGEGFYRIRGKVYPVSGSGLGIYVRRFDKNGKALGDATHLLGLGGAERAWRTFETSLMVSSEVRSLQFWIHSYDKAVVTAYLDDFEIDAIALRSDGTNERSIKDLTVIRERLTRAALGSAGAFDDVRRYMAEQQSDGSWTDIDYENRNRTSWAPTRHVSRIYRMARAWRHPDSPLHNDPELRGAILRAWDSWTRQDLKCPNWWYNVIGVPRIVYRAMLLMGSELTSEQFKAGIRILRNAKLGMTGQNLVWVAEVTVARGCLEQDPWTVQLAFRRMADEIQVGLGEGIQPDYSFYQHGTQLYNGGYGKGFSRDCAYFAALGRGTCFAFGKDRIETLVAYLLDGQQWMVRGPVFDYSACGREIARKGGGKAAGLADACRSLLELDAAALPRRDELERFRERLEHPTPENALRGNRHFWRADYMTHHRAAFMVSVRMTSPRTLQTETCNAENLLGRHLSDGVMYLYRRGDEYKNVFPLWDWKRLPGITVELTPDPPATRNGQRGKRDFVGGVSDGVYGLAAMDFARGRLTARKSWFFFDREIVCLGAGITCPTDFPVVTSLNQCRLKGKVTVADTTGNARPSSRGEHRLQAPGWVLHDGVAYVFPESARVTVRNASQSGNWRRINHVYPKTELSMGVFSLWIDHGKQVENGAYRYVVVPEVTPATAAAIAARSPVTVLSNTAQRQAVRHNESGVLGIVFWTPGSQSLPDGSRIGVDRACLLLLRPDGKRGMRLAVANPENRPLDLTVTLKARFEGEGCVWSAADGVTRVRFALPDGPLAGSSVVRRLSRPGP
ncbi:MAG: polysaccharide lyase 8 family protein [Kiritimatiellaeota bacterium]|nr:polysaccharide lyase 8 family protein [Kiritimatiellota bacterium]